MALLEELMGHVSLTGLLVFFSASFILYFVLNSVDHSMRLRRLPGTKATKVKGTLPFGKPRLVILRALHITIVILMFTPRARYC